MLEDRRVLSDASVFAIGDLNPHILSEPAPAVVAWSKGYGGSSFEEGRSVIETSDGGFISAGWSKVDGKGEDVYVVKTDVNGETQWSKTYGGGNHERAYAIRETLDGFVVCGRRRIPTLTPPVEFMYLLKISKDGNKEWAKTFRRGRASGARDVRVTEDGGFILAGWAGYRRHSDSVDVYVVKTDSNGAVDWQRRYRRGLWQGAHNILPHRNGGYMIAGIARPRIGAWLDGYVMRLGEHGQLRWSRSYGGGAWDEWHGITYSNDGGFVYSGGTGGGDGRKMRVWVMKTTSNGAVMWTRSFALNYAYSWSVVADHESGYVLCGTTPGGRNGYVMKVTEGGQRDWAMKLGSLDNGRQYRDELRSLVATSDGGFVLTGYVGREHGRRPRSKWQSAWNRDLWMAKIKPSGAKCFDTTGVYDADVREWSLNNNLFIQGANREVFQTDIMTTSLVPSETADWIPITGDWNGDGYDTVGMWDPTRRQFHLVDDVGQWTGESAVTTIAPSMSGIEVGVDWKPIAGDWNNDGYDTLGLYVPGSAVWYLSNARGVWGTPVEIDLPDVPESWVPLRGNWDGIGGDSLGHYDPVGNRWYLYDRIHGAFEATWKPNTVHRSDRWLPVTGDWNGDGRDSIGLYNPDTGTWYLNDRVDGSTTDLWIIRSRPTGPRQFPLAGDWDASKRQGIAATPDPVSAGLPPTPTVAPSPHEGTSSQSAGKLSAVVMDVNGDGGVTPLDVKTVVDAANSLTYELPAKPKVAGKLPAADEPTRGNALESHAYAVAAVAAEVEAVGRLVPPAIDRSREADALARPSPYPPRREYYEDRLANLPSRSVPFWSTVRAATDA